MRRFLPATICFFLLALLETGFVASLPLPLRLLPLLIAFGVYLLQHHLSLIGAWWIVGEGLVLDFLHVGSVPVETIPFALGALAGLLASRHVFTNRSFYGLLGSAAVVWSVIGLARGVESFLVRLSAGGALETAVRLREWGIGLFLLLMAVALLFSFASRLRRTLARFFLIPPSRQTY